MFCGLVGPSRPLHAQGVGHRGAEIPGGAFPYPTSAEPAHHVCVCTGFGSGGTGGCTGFDGFTPDELNLCHSLDTDLGFIFAWLEGEMEPEEGELFPASPAVKNFYINRNLFFLDDHKVL